MTLKERRIKAGMTQVEVAVAVGVSLTAYRLWEYGLDKNMEPENRTKLEEVLGHDD